MKITRTQWALVVGATALLVIFAPSDEDTQASKGVRTSKRSPSGQEEEGKAVRPAGHVELDRLAKLESLRKAKGKVGDAFGILSWDEAPAKVTIKKAEVAPPPPPVVEMAPPLPFSYLGRYGDSPSRLVILSKGDKVYTVSVGDVIENTYRVEKYTVGTVNLTYLPLNVEQHLPTGEAL